MKTYKIPRKPNTLGTLAAAAFMLAMGALLVWSFMGASAACARYDPAGPMIITTVEGQQCCCPKRNGDICCRRGFSCIGCFCA